jgi:hypothetical protein
VSDDTVMGIGLTEVGVLKDKEWVDEQFRVDRQDGIEPVFLTRMKDAVVLAK